MTAIRLKTDDNWYGNYTMRICGKTLSHAYYLDKQLQSIKSYTTGNTSDLITKTTFDNSYSVTHTNAVECIKKFNDINPQDITIYTDGSLIKGKTNNTSGAGFTVVQITTLDLNNQWH